jgi:uncharacterized protein with GYD domain
MPTYLHIGTYGREGSAALRDDGGTARSSAVQAAVESVGGTVHAIYWAFGGKRVYAIIDLPDDVTATGLNIAADVAGALSLETVRLHSAAEIDLATTRARGYAPPGVDDDSAT